jgi:hypothetical protein
LCLFKHVEGYKKGCIAIDIKIFYIISSEEMLFMNKAGQYVEILRKNYTSDITYYSAIMNLKGYTPEPTPAVNLVPLGLRFS